MHDLVRLVQCSWPISSMVNYTNESMAIPIGVVAVGLLSLLDQPTTRWALKPTVLGPCCLLGLAYLRSSTGTSAEGSCAASGTDAASLSTDSLLDMLAADVRQATCAAHLPPFFATLVGDLVGLLLGSQFLAMALRARRALASVRVELASGFFRGNPNAVARSGASALKALKRDLMAGAMAVGSQVPGIRGLIAAELASEVGATYYYRSRKFWYCSDESAMFGIDVDFLRGTAIAGCHPLLPVSSLFSPLSSPRALPFLISYLSFVVPPRSARWTLNSPPSCGPTAGTIWTRCPWWGSPPTPSAR